MTITLVGFSTIRKLLRNKNDNKGWWFGEISKVDDNTYSMEVRRPYKDYNGGW